MKKLTGRPWAFLSDEAIGRFLKQRQSRLSECRLAVTEARRALREIVAEAEHRKLSQPSQLADSRVNES